MAVKVTINGRTVEAELGMNLITGEMIADIVPTFGSINMIAGELDR